MKCVKCQQNPACRASKKHPGLCFGCRPRPAAPCRHCANRAVTRPNGLCWGCYYAPGVRELYPSRSKYAKRYADNFDSGPLPLADAPTAAAPGTPEKLAVMGERADRKRAIFHPADARWEGDPRPAEFLKRRAG